MERKVALLGVGLPALVVVGTVVGWLLLSDPGADAVAIGTFVTAIATLGLAGATVYLGVKTRDTAIEARREASTATAALDAQTRPFLTVGSVAPQVLTSRSAHVRNMGNGTAVVSRAAFVAEDGALYRGAAPDPAVPVGETTLIRLATDESGAAAVLDGASSFAVVVEYADVDGRRRGAVRLDVRYWVAARPTRFGDTPDRRWVAQVHWASDLDTVINRPELSSQAVA
jgi:hypothetical protein